MEPRGPQTTIAPLLGPSVKMLNYVKFTTLNNKIFAIEAVLKNPTFCKTSDLSNEIINFEVLNYVG